MDEQKSSDIRQYLSQEKFSDQEVEEILQRAGKIQQESEIAKERIDRADLEAGAAEVGISRDFIDQAIKELRAEKEREIARRKSRRVTSISVVAIAIFVVIVSLFSSHKALNSRLSEVETKRAQLDNVLQRRHDLIPNLISIAKASAAHEEKLIDSLNNLIQESNRTKSFEERQAIEQNLDIYVNQLMSSMRVNPETSSSDMFIRLSDEMAGAENRIAVERKRYNEAVVNYNRTARGFPVSILRPLLGFPGRISEFKASEAAKEVPKF